MRLATRPSISISRAARVAVAGVAGLGAAAVGLAVCAPALVLGDAGVADFVGTAVGLLGVVSVVAAFRLALAGRSRRVTVISLIVALPLLLQFYVLPVVVAGLAGNADRFDVEPARALGIPGARDVSFRSEDGVALAGWFVPGRRGAAVVLAHGSHGSREAVVDHLRLLHRLGYGVLAFDARGHGESGGDPNAFGWRGAPDVAGAVRYLETRQGLPASRIALFGISMGGEEALRAASDGAVVGAIVADGAGASTTGDARAGGQGGLELAVGWLGMRATEVLVGDPEPTPLVDRVSRITAPALLIASDAAGELEIDRVLAGRIGANAEPWHVGGAGHTEGLDKEPAAYARRVSRFLKATLTAPP